MILKGLKRHKGGECFAFVLFEVFLWAWGAVSVIFVGVYIYIYYIYIYIQFPFFWMFFFSSLPSKSLYPSVVRQFGGAMSGFADGIPVVGHIKGGIQYACGDQELPACHKTMDLSDVEVPEELAT